MAFESGDLKEKSAKTNEIEIVEVGDAPTVSLFRRKSKVVVDVVPTIATLHTNHES